VQNLSEAAFSKKAAPKTAFKSFWLNLNEIIYFIKIIKKMSDF
jgi:hypothetical protein